MNRWRKKIGILSLVPLLAVTVVTVIRLVSIGAGSRASRSAHSVVLSTQSLNIGDVSSPALTVEHDESGSNTATRVWAAGSNRLIQVVHRFGNPLLAQWYFRRSDPINSLRYDHPGEVSQPQRLGSARADLEHFFCGATGSAPRTAPLVDCATWMYWGRYGQYVVEVAWGGSQGGMSERSFVGLARTFDAYVGQQVGG
jgi:hypothetical protein